VVGHASTSPWPPPYQGGELRGTVMSSTLDKLRRARTAAPKLAALNSQQKNAILQAIAELLAASQEAILAANRADLESNDLRTSSRDRLLLNPARLSEMLAGIRAVISLPDPVGEVLAEWVRPNGLRIRKVRVPLGVVGVIYESRPNVTVDAAILALKAGNAAVLRGGREAVHTNERLVELLDRAPGLPEGAIELLDSRTHESALELMRARGYVDVLIPRGGVDLIHRVVEQATVPVIETGAGNCHVYVDKEADLELADRIVINAKTQRPSVCNAAEKLLVHRDLAAEYVPRIVARLRAAGVEVRGDDLVRSLAGEDKVCVASAEDWLTEYSDLKMAVAVVASLDEAIAHINRFSTRHSDAIITRDAARAQRFLDQVDSAAV